MIRHPEILEELKALAPGLAAIGTEHPQSAPVGYFESLPAVVLSRIHGEEVLELPGSPSFPEVPAGYFESLATRVMERIGQNTTESLQDETAALAPTLAGIGKKMPHSVPEGYFEGLTGRLVAGQRKPARVISFNTLRVVRYAVAAAVVGLLFTGAWFLIREDLHGNVQPDIAASGTARPDSVPESALANYLDQTEALDALDPSLSETAKPEDMALLNLDDQKVGELLSTMTDKEIADYVNSDPNGDPNVMKN